MISLENLTVRYGRTIALHRIDLALDHGVIGMFGPNGSGKSTLLRTIAGLLKPVAGRVVFDGEPIAASDERWRRRIGYAGHQPGLYEELTIRENLELFGRLTGADRSAVDPLLERIGLLERGNDRVATLSAGLRRRAAVARAVVHEPQVLLLDEPYANLDDDAADRISDIVREWEMPGRIAIVATHGARRLKAFAGHGLVLRSGAVATYRPYDHA